MPVVAALEKEKKGRSMLSQQRKQKDIGLTNLSGAS